MRRLCRTALGLLKSFCAFQKIVIQLHSHTFLNSGKKKGGLMVAKQQFKDIFKMLTFWKGKI